MALKRPAISPDRPNKRAQPEKQKQRLHLSFKARNTRSNSGNPNDCNTDCSDYNDRRSREPEQQTNEQQSPLEEPGSIEHPMPDQGNNFQMLKDGIGKLYNTICKYEYEHEILREHNRLLEEENSMLKLRNKSLLQQIEELATANERLIGEESSIIKPRNESLLQQIEELATANEQLVSTVSQLQARAFKNIEKGGWAPKEDKWIREEFTKLHDMIRCWSREHGVCTSELDNVSKKIKSGSLRDLHVAGYCSETRWDYLIKKSGKFQNFIPMLLIQAFVARDVFENIFDPFFPFFPLFRRNHNEWDPGWPRPAELDKIYKKMKSVNPPDAHIWRSNMLRSLADPLKTDAQELILGQPKGLFNSTPLYLFKSTSDAKRRDAGMQQIYRSAFKLAQCLWTQREYFEVKALDKFEFFDVAENQLVAHRLHHLEDGDRRLNGSKTLICVQPAVIAYGNENAEEYDVSKAWTRATMLLAEASECSDKVPKRQTNGSMDVDEVDEVDEIDETGYEPEGDDDNDPTWPAPKTRGSIVIPLP